MFLTRVEAAVSVMQVEASIRKIMKKFFGEYDLPMPRIKISNAITSKDLGQCRYVRGDHTTLITIQKKIVDDGRTLDRILTHELVHHWEFLVLEQWRGKQPPDSKIARALQRYPNSRQSHGKPFLDWAAKINTVMGKDYVSVVSDSTYVISLDKDYFVLISPSPAYNNRLMWSWAVRPSATQWQIIKFRIGEYKSKLFKTRDDRFMGGPRIKKGGVMAVPHTASEEGKAMEAVLQEMYKSGKEVPVAA